MTALALVIGIGAGGILIARSLWQRNYEAAAYALVATLAVGLTLGISAGAVVRGEGASFKPFAERVAASVPPGESVSFFNVSDETAIAFLFYLRRHVPVVETGADHPCDPPTAGLYLVPEKDWTAHTCFQTAAWQEVTRGGPPVKSQRWRRLVLARYTG